MSTETIIKVELATSEALYKGAMAIRKQVFVKEQRIPESKEFDGNDFCAAHVVAYVQKNNRRLPIGTMRIRFFSDFVKFERMAVIRNFRKQMLPKILCSMGLSMLRRRDTAKFTACANRNCCRAGSNAAIMKFRVPNALSKTAWF